MKKIYLIFLSIALGFTSIAQDLAQTMTVSAGTSVSVTTGTTVYASNVNLQSTSNKFACLLLNGDLGATTIVNYDRYVNVHGTSGVNGGNDLIALPVKETGDVTFGQFLNYSPDDGTTKNSDVLYNSATISTLYAFGPFNNTTRNYVNFDSSTNGGVKLKRGTGYRAATKFGGTLRFTGSVSKNTETVTISTSNSRWNSIGNPYPTYINSQAFLAQNSAVLDPNATAIYGYNSGNAPSSGTFGNFTIINGLSNPDVNIAPGQGFLVANNPASPSNTITFTQEMRTLVGTDDFILGRNANSNQMLRIRAENATADFSTEIYFNENSTLGLDPGYDAAMFSDDNSSLLLYSRLVENNNGQNLSIQSLGFSNLNDVIIPLGLKTAQGRQVTFSIENSTLPLETQVYLEDNVTNTFTLLNSNNYTFTANTAISGTGRFFLRIGAGTLSTIEQNSNNLKLYASEHTIFINGQLLADTTVSIYDIQGRLVMTSQLEEGSSINRIEASSLNSGIYVVKLTNEMQAQTKKVIIK